MSAIAAEWSKLRTLPATSLVIVTTLALTGVIAAALTAQWLERVSDVGARASISQPEIVAMTLPFAQVGLVALCVLSISHEYAGRQLRMSLVAVPNRCSVVVAKTTVVAAVAVVVALATVAVVCAAAWVVFLLVGEVEAPQDMFKGGGALIGAVCYLTLIGLLAHAVAMLLHGLVPALTTTLVLVLLVSPLLAGVGELARWLPDRAASALYLPGGWGDSIGGALSPLTGAFVAFVWIAVPFAAGAWRFIRSIS